MIVKQEVIDAIHLMRRIGADTQRCEVKKIGSRVAEKSSRNYFCLSQLNLKTVLSSAIDWFENSLVYSENWNTN